MKKILIYSVSVMLIGAVICIAGWQEAAAAEPTDNFRAYPVARTDAKQSKAIAFLENFYKGLDEDQLDYAFVKKHTTSKAIQYLADNYDYDCDGNECLATWIFLYEGGGDTGPLKTRTFEMLNKTTCKVTQTYEGYEGQDYVYIVKLGLVKYGDTYKINTIEPVVGSND